MTHTRKRLPLLILLFATLTGLSGCLPKLDDTEQVILWDHFATGFVEKPVIYATLDQRSDLLILYSTLLLRDEKALVTILDETQRKRVETYARQYGDKLAKQATYKGLVRNGGAVIPFHHIYYVTPIDKVVITSTIDWEKELPAGSDLSSHFAFLTNCSDKYAKTQTPYDTQREPQTYPVTNPGYRAFLQRSIVNQTGQSEILYGMLDELDLTGKDYVGIANVVMILTSDHKAYHLPQDLKVTVTFRDGESTEVTIPLHKTTPPIGGV